MSEKLHVALVIPFHNEELYIQATLQSLAQQQVTIPIRWTVIFVNNASTDQTESIIRRQCRKYAIPFRLINESRRGTVYSRTTGLRYGARLGPEVLISTDADTTFPDSFIESSYLDLQNSGADFLCGKRQVCKPVDLWKRLVSKRIYNTHRTLWNLEYELFGQYAFGAYFAIKAKTFSSLPLYNPALCESFIGEDVLLARRCFFTHIVTRSSSITVTPDPRKDIALGINGLGRMSGNTPETHSHRQTVSSLDYTPLSQEQEGIILQQIYAFTTKRLLWSSADALVFWERTGRVYGTAYTSAEKTFHFFDLDIQSVGKQVQKSWSTLQLYKKLLNSYESIAYNAIEQYVETTIR